MRLKKVDDWMGQDLALLDHGQIGKDEHKEGNLFSGNPFNKAQEFLAMAPPDSLAVLFSNIQFLILKSLTR